MLDSWRHNPFGKFFQKSAGSFRAGIGRIRDWICGFGYWVCGVGWDYAIPEEAKQATKEVIALQTLLVAEVLALIGYVYVQNNREPSLIVVALYVGISFIPMIAMIVMLRSPQHVKESEEIKRRAYDRGTVLLCRWCLGMSALMVGAIAYACAAGMLPTKTEKVDLPLGAVKEYKWENNYPNINVRKGDDGIVLYAYLSAATIGPRGAYPNVLRTDVELLGRARKGWQIGDAVGVDFESGKLIDPPTSIYDDSPHLKPVFWQELTIGNKYKLKIKLHRKGEGPSKEELLEEEPSSYIRVRAFLPK